MKHKVLLLSKSPSTSIGLRSYLTNIFGPYIDLEACLTDIVTREFFAGGGAELVLFASDAAFQAAEPFMPEPTPYIRCVRTFNYTYLHRILTIPSGEKVYVVNDTLANARLAIEMLGQVGLSQYHFLPFGPGAGETDPEVRYAVTVGESRLVPKYIPNVVDVGIRVPDISTIAGIAAFFGLPMGLVDEVTKNFISQYVQLLKVANHRLEQANNTKFLTQSIITNIGTGVCVVNGRGAITLVNRPFAEALSIEKPRLVGMLLKEAAPEFYRQLLEARRRGGNHVMLGEEGTGIVVLFQEIEDFAHEKLLFLHCQPGAAARAPRDVRKPEEAACRFEDYLTGDKKTKAMLETAKRMSLTDFRILIEGENGTGKHLLAQAIHSNSGASTHPFYRLHLTALSEEETIRKLAEIYEGNIFADGKGTLYLDGVQCLTEKLQREVLRLLDARKGLRIISSSPRSLYEMCQEGDFLPELFFRLGEVSAETVPVRERPEDIRLLCEYFLRNLCGNPALTWEELFGDGLRRVLNQYPWPGNVKEIANMCKYLSCIQSGGRFHEKDLPPYMLAWVRARQERVGPLERELLSFIGSHPGIGRARLCAELETRGMEVSEGKIRSLLRNLADRGLIKANRTRGGCELTEEGEILL